jgi:hypothetical protein
MDLHCFWKLDPDPHPHYSEKLDVDHALNSGAFEAQKWSRGEPWTLTMEAWRVRRPVVADSHELNEEQDPY